MSGKAGQGARRGRVRWPQRGARHFLCVGGQRDRRARPGPLRGRAGGHRHRRALGAGRRDQRLAITDGELPEVSGGTAVSLVGDPAGRGLAVLEPGPRHRPRADRGRRRLPGAARRLRRGRDDPGTAGDGRAALRRAPACSPARRRWTRSSPRSCSPPPACRRATTWSSATRGAVCPDPDRPGRGGARAARAAGVREAVAGGLQHRHHQGHRLGAVPGRRGDGGGRRPEGGRRGGGARPGDRVRGAAAARGPGCPRRACLPRSGCGPASTGTTSTAKYLDDSVDFDVPADLTPEQTAAVQEAARRAYLALDCRGLARVDFFLGTAPDGSDHLVINEVNTMPGFTPISMFPRMWAATAGQLPRARRPALVRRAGRPGPPVSRGGGPSVPGCRPLAVLPSLLSLMGCIERSTASPCPERPRSTCRRPRRSSGS